MGLRGGLGIPAFHLTALWLWFPFSEPPFPSPENGDNNHVSFMGGGGPGFRCHLNPDLSWRVHSRSESWSARCSPLTCQ